MTRAQVLLAVFGAAVSGCAEPELEPVEAAPVEVAPVELPAYVDPLDAARAQARANDPGDPSWREGFDRTGAEPSSAEPAPAPEPAPEPADEVASARPQPSVAPGPAVELSSSTPDPAARPSISEPLPELDGAASLEPGAVERPPGATPPGVQRWPTRR